MQDLIRSLAGTIEALDSYVVRGRIVAVRGLMAEASGVAARTALGDHVRIRLRDGGRLAAEVVGFRDGRALLMPFGPLDGVALGAEVEASGGEATIRPSQGWLGRVIDGFGRPIDGKGPLVPGARPRPMRAPPPPAHARTRVGAKIDLGVRVLNTFVTCCRGQRLGIFAASGVGKSVLMGMIARYTAADVSVVGLIGERGREVQEFIEGALGPEGLARSVVVVATSDEPALMRRQAAYTTLAVAEHFRDQGADVLCMIDSITRFAQAQREIGLAAGEPPASKGFTPSVFAELPRLLERAGPGTGQGSITGLFTVLVEGDNHDEPVADATRGILDGHIVLERSIGERGRYPAVNVLRSVSRTMPDCNTPEQNAVVIRARRLLSTYEDMAEMIRLGAYRAGSDPAVDEAIRYHEGLERFLSQGKAERATLAEGYDQLAQLLGMPKPGG
ncbi:flagellar protein export ATPase FliI [Tistrella mobilis]|uniref:flagellar protein export ATPase FliI n=1 Tax=Tistrella mobilis TaxID=171437 RepID=UPI003557DB20